ncbi:MAG: site-specific integrase [Sphingomonas sp.]|jgi:integrase/recombinase XerD|nr:site-specific integrase [Sphingomonas sp.]MBW8844144.1 site-specific integrase [Burkholderiales bacterium]
MNLYFSTKDFAVDGQHYEGFPILVDASGAVVEVALLFFVDDLLNRGGARDLKTWAAYGRHMYDYFGYLEQRLAWDHIPAEGSGQLSPLAAYVRWCDTDVRNAPGYVNDKRATIERFYEWAKRVGRIDELPFTRSEVISSSADGVLAHASATRGRRSASNLHLPENDDDVPDMVLSRGQIDAAFEHATNPTHRAVLHLSLNAGLRAEELATFPMKYVVDTSRLSPKVKTVPVTLDPKDMHTKNDKKRTVRLSVRCMNLLWQYREAVRPRLRARAKGGPADSGVLLLTRFGVPFVADGFVSPMARLGKRAGFHIHPHMLRHTFATHTLASLEDLKRAGRLRSSPLVVLKRLLGHSKTTNTERYLHLLDSIEDVYGTRYQAEIDELALGYLNEAEKK